jgi:hypothetical protein
MMIFVADTTEKRIVNWSFGAETLSDNRADEDAFRFWERIFSE